ncbi:MAG: MFS transporter [Chloroflexi bacterium]|nr:MFS transporter [Chloroflexota bacterium]MBT4142105.1 MFS transporter [Chloroflexota bacterium]MBT4942809.1 MFS transporter [Chloroflexota bacterium]MBT5892883.1 MFS transporter [Chloroflexota bacterium]MBT6707115.1 MFS transporter [Chloroflexota bacterium]
MIPSPTSSTFSRPRGPLAAFAFPKFRRVWLASVIFSLGNWGERLATGWVVLNETDDVFLAAATFAVRQAPQLIFAPIGGAVADRFSRGKIVLLISIYKALILTALAIIAANGLEPLWLVFVILGFSGVGQSFELPAIQGMVTSSVPRAFRMNAVAVQSTGMRAVGALGALAAGYAISAIGVPVTFLASGSTFVVGGVLALFANKGLQTRKMVKTDSVVRDVVDGLKLMSTLPIVRMILITAVLVEIFGFAYGAVMPAVAKNALNVDSEGLGTLTMMAGVGSVIGSVFLMALGNFRRKGLLLIGIAIAYGIFLATFSAPGSYAAALVLIMGVGASAAAFDAMQWTLLQLNVPDEMRGRAVGAWVFAIGFGWIGHLGMGAVGEAVGVQTALAGAGIIVVITGIAAYLFSPSMRRI